MGKITERYEKYLPYADYDGNNENELLSLIISQIKLLDKSGIDLKLTSASNMLNIYTNNIYSGIITPYHRHNYFELNYVYEGLLLEYIEGRKFILEAGDLVLMSPDIHHTSHPIGKTTAVNVIIETEFALSIEKMLFSFDKKNYLTYIVKNSDYAVFKNLKSAGIEEIINEINCINNSRSEYEPYVVPTLDNLAKALFLTLTRSRIREYSFRKAAHSGNIILSDENFSEHIAMRDNKILRYINDNICTITLDKMAKQFGYSSQQIRRIVKKNTGMTFATYIQVVRLTRACELLKNSKLTIKSIADTLGIESPEYFSRWFKKEHGVSPSEYRKKHINMKI